MVETLAGLRPGEYAAVLRVPFETANSLNRLGLTPGTEVVCLRRLPLGDPAVYRWRGIEVALRRRDAERIEVEKQDNRICIAVGADAHIGPSCRPG